MRVRDGGKLLVGLAVAAAAVVVPVGAASAASYTTESYDEYTDGQIAGNEVTTFTLGALTYTSDRQNYSDIEASGPLSSGTSDGVLVMNVYGEAMTSVTISLANGHPMKVNGFDLDTAGGMGTIEVIPDADSAHE